MLEPDFDGSFCVACRSGCQRVEVVAESLLRRGIGPEMQRVRSERPKAELPQQLAHACERAFQAELLLESGGEVAQAEAGRRFRASNRLGRIHPSTNLLQLRIREPARSGPAHRRPPHCDVRPATPSPPPCKRRAQRESTQFLANCSNSPGVWLSFVIGIDKGAVLPPTVLDTHFFLNAT